MADTAPLPTTDDEDTAAPDLVPPRVRTWLYGVATASGPLLGFYGLVEDAEWALWLGLLVAVLGNGTASAYRPARFFPRGG